MMLRRSAIIEPSGQRCRRHQDDSPASDGERFVRLIDYRVSTNAYAHITRVGGILGATAFRIARQGLERPKIRRKADRLLRRRERPLFQSALPKAAIPDRPTKQTLNKATLDGPIPGNFAALRQDLPPFRPPDLLRCPRVCDDLCLLVDRKAPISEPGKRSFHEPGLKYRPRCFAVGVKLGCHAQLAHRRSNPATRFYMVAPVLKDAYDIDAIDRHALGAGLLDRSHRRARSRTIALKAAFGHVEEERFRGRHNPLCAINADRHGFTKHGVIRWPIVTTLWSAPGIATLAFAEPRRSGRLGKADLIANAAFSAHGRTSSSSSERSMPNALA